MMSKRERDEQRAILAAHVLENRPHVLAVERVCPSIGPYRAWTLEITLEREAEGLPPCVGETLVDYGLTTKDVGRRGALWTVLAVA